MIECTNNGCNQKFTLSDNHPEACLFHPGVAVFHEGRKGWSCCKRRVDSFDEFLDIPGCASGSHSDAKPQAAPATTPAPKPTPNTPTVVSTEAGVETFSSTQITPTPDAAKIAPKPVLPDPEDPADALIVEGSLCRRQGCQALYRSEHSREEACTYHPGNPVFHEGSKGWSCCKKNAAEFEEFMKMKGCKTGKHRFCMTQEEAAAAQQAQCRHDWYQNRVSVIASVYAKGIIKDKSSVQFDDRTVTVSLSLPSDKKYHKVFRLAGPIDPRQSQYEFLSTKVEINLVKADGATWARMEEDEPEVGRIQVANAGKVVHK
eukprot:TRINITY_DN6453_c0_g1_i2.p1 TRINITY_DN6453_c0_g1~~TRINITY_DN6453_c0_g1_i2.p1  ORF type:complete len:331 (-),score=84.54 TRINITY_DN6453_c0_g1_i2:5-955(-)